MNNSLAYGSRGQASETKLRHRFEPAQLADSLPKNESRLRICHLGKYYHPFRGGIETHVRSLAQAQAEIGHDVTVVCINHIDAGGNDVWCNRYARTPTVQENDGQITVRRFGKLGTLARFDFCRGIRSMLKRAAKNYDLLHLHVPNPAMCVWLASVHADLPVVVTYHSDIVKQRFIRKPFRIVEDRIFGKVDRIIVATENYRDSSQVLKHYLDKTTVVPFGLDLQPYQTPTPRAVEYAAELRASYGDQPLWLSVGRLVYYKGFEYAVRALKDSPGRLLMIGHGELYGSLKALAESLGVADRVIWRGGLDDDELRGAYLAATALWFPSILRSEAFGLVQIEAMASGCPVINTDIAGSGVPWVSRNGVSGLTVPVQDASALAEAARSLVERPGLRDRLSAGAIQRAHELFDVRKMTQHTMSVYDSVLMRTAVVAEPSSMSHAEPANDLIAAERRST